MGWKEISIISATGKRFNAYKRYDIDIGCYFSLYDIAQLISRMKQNGKIPLSQNGQIYTILLIDPWEI